MASNDRITYTMTYIPSVIKIILRYLTAKELCKCAQVCKIWNEIIISIKKKRCEPFILRELSASLEKDMVTPVSDSNIGKRFVHRLQQSWCEPDLAIIFSSCGAYGEFFETPFKYFLDLQLACKKILPTNKLSQVHSFPETEQRQTQILTNYLKSFLPRKCRLVYFCVSQVLEMESPADHTAYGITVSAPMDHRKRVLYRKGFSAVLLPSLPGISVEPFSITYPEFYFDILDHSRLKVVGLPDLPPNHSRCYLGLFCKEGVFALHKEILNSLKIRKCDLFISIKTHKCFYLGVPADHYQVCAGLLFSGEKIVIKCLKFCSSCVKTKLESLKNQGIPDRGIGFLLAKSYFYNTGSTFTGSDCILNIFHNLFPKIQIFGVTLLPNIETVFSYNLSSFSPENSCSVCNKHNDIAEKFTEEISIILLILF